MAYILYPLLQLLSLILVAWVTHYFTRKSKKYEIIYQNRINAFKEISEKIVDIRKFCSGRLAYFNGQECSPFWESEVVALHHCKQIANISEHKSIYLSKKSKRVLKALINDMYFLSKRELCLHAEEIESIHMIKDLYINILNSAERCHDLLYSEQ